MLVRAVDDAAGDAGMVVVLQPRHKVGKDGVQQGSANAQRSPPQGTMPLTKVPEGAWGRVCPPVISARVGGLMVEPGLNISAVI